MFILTEYQEQTLLIDWLIAKGLKFSALPLSTYTTSWAQKRKNHAMGVRAGVPDLMVIIPPREGCAMSNLAFIEMKRTKGGVTSPEQKDWIIELNKCQGVEAKICKGYDKAKEFIEELL